MPKIDIKGHIIPNEYKAAYDFYGMEATCPNDVKKVLEQSTGLVDVDITTSYGGNIFAGSDIYTMLRDYKNIYIRVFSLAASATSIIATAGPSEISPTAMFFAHLVEGGEEGNYHAMDKASGMLKSASEALATAYMEKTGMSKEEALGLMEKESWLTAQQAVDLKLIDKVMFSQDPRNMVAAIGTPLPQAAIEKANSILRNQKQLEASAAEKEKFLLMLDLI